jgi:sugar lactone lactonase YvrE
MHHRTSRCFGFIFAAVIVAVLQRSPAAACPGDCDSNDTVVVAELVRSVNVALGRVPLSQCGPIDETGDGGVSIEELVRAVDAFLNDCPEPVITTIAGTGVQGLNEDGLPPTSTHLYLPQDVTVGPEGDLYIIDWNNHRIRRIRRGVIQTVAGTGELGDAKDGIGIYTQFNHPTNVEFDDEGNMIIAAWHNSLVKRMKFPDGLDSLETAFVENVAGTGARSFNPADEGRPANSAALDLPSSVVIDSNGNIIISDQANYRLRQVETDGTIHTICGTGTPGYSGDGGPAIDAELSAPKGQSAPPAGRIAIDDRDRIYIADTANHCIRVIEPGTFTIDTIAGTGQPGYGGDGGPADEAQLDTPSDVAVGPNGSVYVADTMNHRVRVIKTDGTIETLAGTGERGFSGDGGPAKDAELDRPFGLTVGPNGTIYVADTHNQRVRQITGFVPVVPTPEPTPPPVIIPCTGEVGSICTYAGTGATGFSGDGQDRLYTVLYWPFDIEFTSRGRRIVLDWNNHLVREILPAQDDPEGEGTIEPFLTLVGSDTLGDGPKDLSDLSPEGADGRTVELNHPTDALELSDGDVIFLAWHNHKIRSIDSESGRVFVLMGRGAGRTGDDEPLLSADQTLVNQPPHGALDANGNLFFIDQRNQRIRVIYNFDQERKNALVRTVVGNPGTPATPGFNGDGPALDTKLSFPTGGNPEPSGGLAIDTNGVLYFSDTNNHRIRKVEFSSSDFLDGEVTTIAGTGEAGFSGDGGPAEDAQVNFPQDMEIGPDGNLYFADANNHRVRMIDLSTNVITTVAGTGEEGYGGDGGPATGAQLNRPFGVAFDAEGDLYVSDTFNSRIRKVER